MGAALAALHVEAALDQPPSSEMDEESGSKRAGCGAPPPPFAACPLAGWVSLAADFLPDAFADVTAEALSAVVRARPCNLGADVGLPLRVTQTSAVHDRRLPALRQGRELLLQAAVLDDILDDIEGFGPLRLQDGEGPLHHGGPDEWGKRVREGWERESHGENLPLRDVY